MSHALGQATHATLTRDDVYMPITPMFHVHAWGVPYLATMLGVKQVYPGRYVPEALLATIAREGVTFSHCVPTILQMLLSRPEAAATYLSRWKVIIGGSALPVALARAAAERGIDIIAGYGMSETCPILTLAHLRPHMLTWNLEQRLPYLCRAGRPIPFVQLRVVDEDMKDVPHDGESPGEVVVRAPWLTQGYLHDEAKSAELWRGGWLHTGDVGTLDADGYFAHHRPHQGRGEERRRMVVVARHRGPDPAHAAGGRGRGGRHARREVGRAGPWRWWCARPAGEACLTEGDVRAHVSDFAARGAISRYAVPQRVHFVDAIPKTSVGKIDKKVIRAKLAEGVA